MAEEEKSLTMGSSPVGKVRPRGLVEKRGSRPPHGAQSLHEHACAHICARKPACDSGRMCGARAPSQDRLRPATIATPHALAFSAAISLARRTASWPKPLWPSMSAVAARSATISGSAVGSISSPTFLSQ